MIKTILETLLGIASLATFIGILYSHIYVMNILMQFNLHLGMVYVLFPFWIPIAWLFGSELVSYYEKKKNSKA